MREESKYILTYAQIEADLFVAKATIDKAKELSSNAGKYYRGQAGYHLQQAAEKLIKIQIYNSGASLDYAKLYRHSLDDLLTYATSIGVTITIPKWVDEKKYSITAWEAEGRYDLHFVVRMDTLEKAYTEITNWYESLRK